MSNIKNRLLIMNLRTFDEGEDEPVAKPVVNPTQTPPSTPDPVVTPTTPPSGKTFSEDYVKALRDETKTHRLAKQEHERTLRALIGLKDDENVTSERIAAYQSSLEKDKTDVLSKANERLITAEIKSLEGYNHKLLSKLVDRSKIQIDDDGNVTGLKEATDALEVEFPEIKKGSQSTGTNPAGGGGQLTDIQQLEADYVEAMKGSNLAVQISLKNKIFEHQQKQKG